MQFITFDLGSYSIKVLEGRIDRRKVGHRKVHEWVLNQEAQSPLTSEELTQKHIKVLRKFFKGISPETKTIFQISDDMVSNRFLTLPVSNKKKAELMIPFQLEENLPYEAGKSHYSPLLMTQDDTTFALTSFVPVDRFEEMLHKYEESQVLPTTLTTEISLWQVFAKVVKPRKSYAILDLGHSGTKAYFVENGKVVSSHHSFVGGSLIDQVIGQSYQISLDEAIAFKHRNSFFLTRSQMKKVDEDQREFGKLMSKVYSPLIGELKRWILGHRVEFGNPPEMIYLCGGCSSIKNIENFLSQDINSQFQLLPSIENYHFEGTTPKETTKRSIYLAHLAALGMGKKFFPLNLRSGPYASTSYEDIPLHSASFIGTRVVAILLMIVFSVLVERFFLSKEEKALDTVARALIKKPALDLSNPMQRSYRKKPERILEVLEKREIKIGQEVKSIQSASTKNALGPIFTLMNHFSQDPNFYLVEFNNNGEIARATFKAADNQSLDSGMKKVQATGLEDLEVDVEKNDLQVIATFKGY